MDRPILEVKNLSYVSEKLISLDLKTQKIQILQDLNFSIGHHEIVGLVGPNGSGKTTVSKLLTQIIEPTAGQIYFDGINYFDFKPQWKLHENISLVFQNVDAQFIGSNFEEDIDLYLGNFGWSNLEKSERINQVIKQFNIYDLVKRPFKNLSGGQKQILAIAESMAVKPQILILDEPTAQLDPENSQMVLSFIQQLKNDLKISILLITHKAAELDLTDRVLVLNHGKIVNDCQTSDLLKDIKQLEHNQLPVPDTIEIANMINNLTGKKIYLSDSSIESFMKEILKHVNS